MLNFSTARNSFSRLIVATLLLAVGAFTNVATAQTNRANPTNKPQTKRPSGTKSNTRPKKESAKPAAGQLLSLDELLQIAMKHNPDILAAEAKRQLADAELNRTRLGVIKSITAYQAEGQFVAIAAEHAKSELFKALEVNKRQAGTISEIELQRLSLEVEKAKASVIRHKTQLPYLLGTRPGRAMRRPTAQPELGMDELDRKARDVAEKIVKLKLGYFQRDASASIAEIVEWSGRLMKADLNLAKSQVDRIVAIDAYRKRLTQLKKFAETRFNVGQSTLDDVLVLEYQLLQAEQQMQRTKSASTTK